jgi:hypothetical protein
MEYVRAHGPLDAVKAMGLLNAFMQEVNLAEFLYRRSPDKLYHFFRLQHYRCHNW